MKAVCISGGPHCLTLLPSFSLRSSGCPLVRARLRPAQSRVFRIHHQPLPSGMLGFKSTNVNQHSRNALVRWWGASLVHCRSKQIMYTVEPACKVGGFVQQKLTIQEGFCCLTLQPGILIKNMIIWDLLELTLHPFWPYISGSYKRAPL